MKSIQDQAQKLYEEKNKSLDLNRNIDNYAMWSFGLAISLFILIGIPFINFLSPVISIVAIVFGIISITRIKKDSNFQGKGFAISGIIIGLLELVIMLFFILAYFQSL